MMKKIMIVVCMTACIITNTQAAFITNTSNYSAQVRVTYNVAQCGDNANAENNFYLPSKVTADISGAFSKPIKGANTCQSTIASIKVSLIFDDGTELVRTSYGPFGNYITIGSIYPPKSSIAPTALQIK